MTTDDLNLQDYCAKHRTRVRGHEDGYVAITGKRTKKWIGFYHVYKRRADGTETRIKRKRIIGEYSKMTKAEAREEHRTWIRRFNEQPVATSAKMTVAQLCDDYLQLRSGDREEGTRKTTTALFANIIKPEIGERAIESIQAEDLKRLVNRLPERKWRTSGRYERDEEGKLRKVEGITKTGVSHSYAKKVITNLRAIFDLAHERNLISKNPARSINIRLTMPKQARKADKSVFPPQHLPAFLAELDARDSLIVWISMLGATRPGELFAIKGADVGPDWIHVQRALDHKRQFKNTKTEKPRYIQLPPQTAEELRLYIKREKVGPDDLVFQAINRRGDRIGKPINRANFLKRKLRGAAKRAKIPVTDVDFQMLRRSFATIAQLVGFDVKAIQAQLGHSRPDMTAGEYMQPIDELRTRQMRRLEDILRGREPMSVDIIAKLGSITIQ